MRDHTRYIVPYHLRAIHGVFTESTQWSVECTTLKTIPYTYHMCVEYYWESTHNLHSSIMWFFGVGILLVFTPTGKLLDTIEFYVVVLFLSSHSHLCTEATCIVILMPYLQSNIQYQEVVERTFFSYEQYQRREDNTGWIMLTLTKWKHNVIDKLQVHKL